MSSNLPSPEPSYRSQDWVRVVVLLLFLFLIGFGAVPHYLAGQWSGSNPPRVQGLKTLQSFVKGELEVPGWASVEEGAVRIGELEWFQYVMDAVSSPDKVPAPTSPLKATEKPLEAIVLLRGQKGHRDRPQVEWTDLRGDRRWTEDSLSTLQVGNTTARWFRAWWAMESGTIRTAAVVQWYGWPSLKQPAEPWSGHWSSNAWFWQDWTTQWQGHKKPWIAVVVIIPIEPLGDITVVEPEARSLVENIQTALGSALGSALGG